MGNYISCSSGCACACLVGDQRQRKLQSCMIMVVHAEEGRVIEVSGGGAAAAAPMKVAEIMLEFPGHFVSECEQDMKRATPLPADHEALPGRVYILFPMPKLHTRVSPHECSSYINLLHTHIVSSHLTSLKKKKSHYKHSNGSKVTPLNMQFSSSPPQEQPPTEECPSDEELDAFLLQFCSGQPPKASTIFSNNTTSSSGTLMRSRSWIPKLETISES